MKARAPGKVVVSGAYAVLEGSPAIVTAVDRYVTADTELPADFVTPEVRAALGDRPAPWFDASSLRDDGQKLGLGSSAAIVVASLAALEASERGVSDDATLRDAVLPRALRAHRQAQGGGSGVDVATSAYGGTVVAARGRPSDSGAVALSETEALLVRPVRLPRDLVVEVWASGTPASTPGMVTAVRGLKKRDPETYAGLMTRLDAAARAATRATDEDRARDFIDSLVAQCEALDELGRAANVPIVTGAVRDLSRRAREERAIVLPAGAGGGDIAIFVGLAPPSPELGEARRAAAHHRLELRVEARGVHLSD